jgi:NADH:ubiquinone oxidoreductase subunit 3 (subunit A)
MIIDIEVVEKRNNNYLPLLFLLLGGFIFTLKNFLYNIGIIKLKSIWLKEEKLSILNLIDYKSDIVNYKYDLLNINENKSNMNNINIYNNADFNISKNNNINLINNVKDNMEFIKTKLNKEEKLLNNNKIEEINIKNRFKEENKENIGNKENIENIENIEDIENKEGEWHNISNSNSKINWNKGFEYINEEYINDINYLLVIPNWESSSNRGTQISGIGDVLYTVYHSYIYIISVLLLLGMMGAIILTADNSQVVKVIAKSQRKKIIKKNGIYIPLLKKKVIFQFKLYLNKLISIYIKKKKYIYFKFITIKKMLIKDVINNSNKLNLKFIEINKYITNKYLNLIKLLFFKLLIYYIEWNFLYTIGELNDKLMLNIIYIDLMWLIILIRGFNIIILPKVIRILRYLGYSRYQVNKLLYFFKIGKWDWTKYSPCVMQPDPLRPGKKVCVNNPCYQDPDPLRPGEYICPIDREGRRLRRIFLYDIESLYRAKKLMSGHVLGCLQRMEMRQRRNVTFMDIEMAETACGDLSKIYKLKSNRVGVGIVIDDNYGQDQLMEIKKLFGEKSTLYKAMSNKYRAIQIADHMDFKGYLTIREYKRVNLAQDSILYDAKLNGKFTSEEIKYFDEHKDYVPGYKEGWTFKPYIKNWKPKNQQEWLDMFNCIPDDERKWVRTGLKHSLLNNEDFKHKSKSAFEARSNRSGYNPTTNNTENITSNLNNKTSNNITSSEILNIDNIQLNEYNNYILHDTLYYNNIYSIIKMLGLLLIVFITLWFTFYIGRDSIDYKRDQWWWKKQNKKINVINKDENNSVLNISNMTYNSYNNKSSITYNSYNSNIPYLPLIPYNYYKKKGKSKNNYYNFILPFFYVTDEYKIYYEDIKGTIYYYLVATLVVAVLLFCLNVYLSISVKYLDKGGGFECGFTSFIQTRERYNVIFYRVSLLFLIFDLEIILLYPFTTASQKKQAIVLFNVLVFIYILIVGFIYELKEGALNIVKKPHSSENNLNR